MRIFLQSQDDHFKTISFYNIYLDYDLFQSWILINEWGHIGLKGKSSKKIFLSYNDAVSEITNQRDKLIKKGYQILYTEGD
jgi:predicted DNA-binding WGR domain protein